MRRKTHSDVKLPQCERKEVRKEAWMFWKDEVELKKNEYKFVSSYFYFQS